MQSPERRSHQFPRPAPWASCSISSPVPAQNSGRSWGSAASPIPTPLCAHRCRRIPKRRACIPKDWRSSACLKTFRPAISYKKLCLKIHSMRQPTLLSLRPGRNWDMTPRHRPRPNRRLIFQPTCRARNACLWRAAITNSCVNGRKPSKCTAACGRSSPTIWNMVCASPLCKPLRAVAKMHWTLSKVPVACHRQREPMRALTWRKRRPQNPWAISSKS